MIEPKFPENEKLRQQAVERYNILDTLPEDSYNSITELMCYITESPISLITLLDNNRNYIKSNCGFPLTESPRNISFCGHAINSEKEIMIVEDARNDVRFMDNPLVSEHNAIFYAGVPLINPDGYKLGTLCVYDHKPKQLNDAQKKALISMSKQVIALFELRLTNNKLEKIKSKLENRNKELNTFAGVVSHDLKSPLANIISLTELLEEENKGKLNEDSLTYLEYLKDSSTALKNYIDGLLNYYKNEDILTQKKESLTFQGLMLEVKKIAIPNTNNVALEYSNETTILNVNKSVLLQVLINLVTNAVKYNNKSLASITIDFDESESDYKFSVKDNGVGIPNDKLDSIFELFETLNQKDKNGNVGTGIGLATVKKLIESQGGNITVNSEFGVGSNFEFTISKF